MLELTGIPSRTADGVIYSLQHSAASRTARHGVPLIVAARVLGHASTEMTSRVYVHTTTEDLRQAIVEVPTRQSRTA